MSAADSGSPRRVAVLRASLRAYPAIDRGEYGEDLLDAASDLAASGSTLKEVGGLVRGGLEARVRRGRAGLLAVDRTATAELLVGPLTGAVVALGGAGAVARMTGGTSFAAVSRPGVTLGAVALLAFVALLAVAVARRQRNVAVLAALLLLGQVALSAGWSQWRGGLVTAAPHLSLHVGPWWFGPSLVWSLVPFLVLLVFCCAWMVPAGARLDGVQRPRRERSGVRLLMLLSPSAAAAAVLLLRPSLLLNTGTRETTELPGLLFLMLIVAAFWFATSSPAGRDHWSAAAALLGLAAVPSVAYGFADLIYPFLLGTAPMRLGLVLMLSALLVTLSVAVFLAALSSVGLRTGAGAPALGRAD